MNRNKLTPTQIRELGIDALVKYLAYVGTVRFLQQFELRSGDYTQDREEWLGHLKTEDVLSQIKLQSSSEDTVPQ